MSQRKPKSQMTSETPGTDGNSNVPRTSTQSSSSSQKSEVPVNNVDWLYRRVILPLQGLNVFGHVLVISYMTYQTYLEGEEHLPWQKDPVMNPSWASQYIERGKDTVDSEWRYFLQQMTGAMPLMFVIYVFGSQCILMWRPKLHTLYSCIASYVLLSTLMSPWACFCLYAMTVVYWIILRLKSKFTVWMMTLVLLVGLSDGYGDTLAQCEPGLPEYLFHITTAWSISRCMSYCFDTIEEADCCSAKGLVKMIQYVYYFPLTVHGPLVLYKNFRKHMIERSNLQKSRACVKMEAVTFVLKVLRLASWALAIELLLHYLYFWPMALSGAVLRRCNWWALSGVVFWLGVFFQMKYVVMYGISTAMAEFDGMPMPRLPRCVAYIHRYSVLWKDFDRGLYDYMVAYIYVPSWKALKHNRFTTWWNPVLLKLTASFLTFAYVYLWHGTQWYILVWAFFNFVGITVERIGSTVKQKIDTKFALRSEVWDLLIEPVATVPLAIMSIINSAVFCGTLNTAKIVVYRFFTESHWVMPLFLFMTQSGVAVRMWEVHRSKTSKPKKL